MICYDMLWYGIESEVIILGLEKLPEIITAKQLAEFLQISETTVKRALKSGELQGFKAGRDWRIEKESVIRWLKK